MYSVGGTALHKGRVTEGNKTGLSVAPGERGPDPVTSLISAKEAVQMIVNVPGPREGFLDDVDKVCLSWNSEQGTGKV